MYKIQFVAPQNEALLKSLLNSISHNLWAKETGDLIYLVYQCF